MGARNLSRALSAPAWLLCAASGAAQSVPARVPEQSEHVRAVRAERESGLLAAYALANDAARAACAAELEAQRSPGAPLNAWPGFEALAAARCALEGREPCASEQLARAAAALDVQLLPGWLEGSSAARTGPTARIYPLFASPLPGRVHLELTWVGADAARHLARREWVDPGAWMVPGFECYLELPPGPGRWWLEIALSFDGAGALAEGLEFAVFDTALAARVPAHLDAQAAQALAHSAHLLASAGLREPSGALPWVFGADAHARARAAEVMLPWKLASEDPRAADSLWQPALPVQAPGAARRVLAILQAPGQSPRALLRQPWASSERPGWRELALRAAAELVAVDAEVALERRLVPTLEALRAARPTSELVLVARGEAATHLATAWALGDRPRLDGLVLSVDSHAMRALDADLSTLVVAPARTRAALREVDGARAEHVDGAASSFLSELELASWIASWIERQDSARASAAGR